MGHERRPSRIDFLLATPVQSSLLTLGPLVLIVGQLLNGYVNGVSPLVVFAFCAVMGAFAVLSLRHQAAAYRLERLERDLPRTGE